MARRRYIQVNGELVEVPLHYVAPLRTNTDSVLWNDRQYQDCGDPRFKSRTEHREYLRSRGLTTADDFKGEWGKSERERAAIIAGWPTKDRTRVDDVARAAEMVARGHKPKVREEW